MFMLSADDCAVSCESTHDKRGIFYVPFVAKKEFRKRNLSQVRFIQSHGIIDYDLNYYGFVNGIQSSCQQI